MPIPKFVVDDEHRATVCGQDLVFKPITAPIMFRCRSVSSAAARVLDALLTRQGFEERQRSFAAFFEAVGKDPELAGLLVLDALRSNEGFPPANPKNAKEFVEGSDGPSVARLLRAVAEVNVEAFAPFVEETVAVAAKIVSKAAEEMKAATATIAATGGGS